MPVYGSRGDAVTKGSEYSKRKVKMGDHDSLFFAAPADSALPKVMTS